MILSNLQQCFIWCFTCLKANLRRLSCYPGGFFSQDPEGVDGGSTKLMKVMIKNLEVWCRPWQWWWPWSWWWSQRCWPFQHWPSPGPALPEASGAADSPRQLSSVSRVQPGLTNIVTVIKIMIVIRLILWWKAYWSWIMKNLKLSLVLRLLLQLPLVGFLACNLLITVVVVFYYCDMGEDWYNCYTLKNTVVSWLPGP